MLFILFIYLFLLFIYLFIYLFLFISVSSCYSFFLISFKNIENFDIHLISGFFGSLFSYN